MFTIVEERQQHVPGISTMKDHNLGGTDPYVYMYINQFNANIWYFSNSCLTYGIQKPMIKYWARENILEHNMNCKYMIPPLIKLEQDIMIHFIIYNTSEYIVSVPYSILEYHLNRNCSHMLHVAHQSFIGHKFN